MLKRLASALLLCAVIAWAKDKAPHQYDDAILVSFRSVTAGSSCSNSVDATGNVDATTDDTGTTTGTIKTTARGSTNCSDTSEVNYTLSVGEHVYVLRIAYGFNNTSNLARVLPGSHVQVRNDHKGFYVLVGKKESKFDVIEAR